nr:DUF305 domain-containing protein [Candidatus Cyanaurora vandensis]
MNLQLNRKFLTAFVLASGLILGGIYLGAPRSVAQMMKQDETMKMDKPMSDMGMMQNLGPADKEYDLRFMNAMIEHHEGAMVMAQDALKKSKRPEIQKLAKDIITAQQKEIAQMKTWRKAWYQK